LYSGNNGFDDASPHSVSWVIYVQTCNDDDDDDDDDDAQRKERQIFNNYCNKVVGDIHE
jgi:hypothetical protein